MKTTLSFDDFEPGDLDFTYEGKSYVLKEASASVAKKFNNERAKRLIFNSDGGIVGMRDMGDLEPMLVQLCLTDENGNALPLSQIEKWPHRVISKLFEKAEEISGLKQTSPAFEELKRALDSNNAPTSPEEFVKFVTNLPAEYEYLKAEVKSWDAFDPKE